MNTDEALSLLDDWVVENRGQGLSPQQKEIFRRSWEDQEYDDMEIFLYKTSYIKQLLGPQLWKLLSEVIGEPVSKKTLRIVIEAALKVRSRLQPPAVIESATVEPEIAANNQGFDSYTSGDLTQANKQFELAIKINSENAASYYNQAWSYEQVGDFDRAIELYRQAAFQGFSAAYCNLARLHIIEEKKYDLAVNICGRGLELVQQHTIRHLDRLGFCRDRASVSASLLEIIKTDKSVKAALLTYLAWAWIEQGRDEEALEKLQEAIELDGDRALIPALMAQALDNLGHRKEASEAWKNYVNKYPKCDHRDKNIWMAIARQRLKEL